MLTSFVLWVNEVLPNNELQITIKNNRSLGIGIKKPPNKRGV